MVKSAVRRQTGDRRTSWTLSKERQVVRGDKRVDRQGRVVFTREKARFLRERPTVSRKLFDRICCELTGLMPSRGFYLVWMRHNLHMPSALITGITGQDGLYLAELLLAKGYEVHGLIRGQNNPKRDLVKHIVPEVTLHHGDLTDLSSLIRALRDAQPDEVYNLGAVSFVAFSWENALHTTEVTGTGVLNMLEAVRLHTEDDPTAVRFYQASSSEMFGKVQEVPQREHTLLWPRSPYGVAKVYGHYMTINYRESYGMHTSSGILFNHESPRRGPEFVTRKISQAVARIAKGQQQEVTMGNLDAQRDWGFAGDYVEAMWLMLQQPEGDDFVIATGETHSVRDFLDVAFNCVGISDWARYVSQDSRFMRPAEVDQLVGDATKAREVLGWKPKVDFKELVAMMVHADLAALEP
jgi:GDPmannose 4,6-dehydratase